MPNASSQTTYNAPARATDVSHSGRECKHRLVIIMKTKRCSCLRLESYYVQVRFFCVCVCWRQFHRFVCFSKHDIATSSPWFETRQKRVLVALAGCICCAHDDLPSPNFGCTRSMYFVLTRSGCRQWNRTYRAVQRGKEPCTKRVTHRERKRLMAEKIFILPAEKTRTPVCYYLVYNMYFEVQYIPLV